MLTLHKIPTAEQLYQQACDHPQTRVRTLDCQLGGQTRSQCERRSAFTSCDRHVIDLETRTMSIFLAINYFVTHLSGVRRM